MKSALSFPLTPAATAMLNDLPVDNQAHLLALARGVTPPSKRPELADLLTPEQLEAHKGRDKDLDEYFAKEDESDAAEHAASTDKHLLEAARKALVELDGGFTRAFHQAEMVGGVLELLLSALRRDGTVIDWERVESLIDEASRQQHVVEMALFEFKLAEESVDEDRAARRQR